MLGKPRSSAFARHGSTQLDGCVLQRESSSAQGCCHLLEDLLSVIIQTLYTTLHVSMNTLVCQSSVKQSTLYTRCCVSGEHCSFHGVMMWGSSLYLYKYLAHCNTSSDWRSFISCCGASKYFKLAMTLSDQPRRPSSACVHQYLWCYAVDTEDTCSFASLYLLSLQQIACFQQITLSGQPDSLAAFLAAVTLSRLPD